MPRTDLLAVPTGLSCAGHTGCFAYLKTVQKGRARVRSLSNAQALKSMNHTTSIETYQDDMTRAVLRTYPPVYTARNRDERGFDLRCLRRRPHPSAQVAARDPRDDSARENCDRHQHLGPQSAAATGECTPVRRHVARACEALVPLAAGGRRATRRH